MVEYAVKDNEVNIPESILEKLPCIPDATNVPRLRCDMKNILIEPKNIPVTMGQLIRTETSFVHLRLGINIANLPDRLRPFLLLFQELLFQSPLVLPGCNGVKTITMDYRNVARYASEILISYEAAVGFGNELWTTNWLSDVFLVNASAMPADWERMVRFVAQVIMFSSFTEERIISIAKNLRSGLSEVKRDGNNVLTLVSSRLYCSTEDTIRKPRRKRSY